LDISMYLQGGLFTSGPVTARRQFFNLFGQHWVPCPTVDASSIVACSIGVVAGSSWPERTRDLLVVAAGFALADVVKTRAERVRTRLRGASAWPSGLWSVADVVGGESVNRWVSIKVAGRVFGGAFFDGAAWGLTGQSSNEVAKSWVAGVNHEWAAAAESGLVIERQPPFEGYDSWREMVDGFLTAHEQGSPFEEAPGMAPRPFFWNYGASKSTGSDCRIWLAGQ
jgi:hypothetical protein